MHIDKKLVTGLLLVLALSAVFAGSTHKWPWISKSASAAQAAAKDEKRVLFWYDAMEPSHHYAKPGKAPDGMDLVPMFESATAPEQPNAAAISSAPASDRKVLFWYDPMHPKYTADKPGIAPDCGMTLVPKYADEASTASMAAGTVTIPADKQTLAGVRTTTAERKMLTREIHTTAQITADETRIAHVHVKVAGYLDEVFAGVVGQLIKKGEPLFTLYSPELVSAEEEYLIAKRGEKTLGSAPFAEVADGAKSLLHSSREKLKLWDISDEQVRQLDETGKVTKDLTFYAPSTGFITDRKAFPQTSVNPDTELYTLTDLSTVWANADVYESELPYVQLGQKMQLTLSFAPGKTYTGTISYIYPTVDPLTHTAKVRMQIPNSDFALKPQMFADAQLHVNYGTKVVVPREAILDSGKEQTVYVVHQGGMFEPRKVTLGPAFDGNVAILSGLTAGETIVISGNFLVDSESKLKGSATGDRP
jgi:multidrug efflux pump subunit AcrA (membrane-fusion protein)